MFHAHIFYLTFTFLWIGKPSFWEVQPQEDNESFDCSFLRGVCEGKIIPKLMISIALVLPTKMWVDYFGFRLQLLLLFLSGLNIDRETTTPYEA